MTDFYPLIARTVARLDANTPENRQLLYQHALDTLERILEQRNDLPVERIALRQAIRRVELEASLESPYD